MKERFTVPLSLAETLAPELARVTMASVVPALAAHMSGSLPSWSFTLTRTPWPRRRRSTRVFEISLDPTI